MSDSSNVIDQVTIFHVDGKIEMKIYDPTKGQRLKFLQDIIGGDIQDYKSLKKDMIIYCDEDGLLRKLKPNPSSMKLCGRILVGTLVECSILFDDEE